MASRFISDLWHKWNIRGSVMLSLSLQVFLILFAPIRKQTASNLIVSFLWLAYLMATWVAPFAIGLISHNQRNLSASAAEVEGTLQAFWASFLLLHFGGPNNIAAFSLDDSRFWLRHVMSFIFQVSATIYVLVKIFPNDKLLVIPTLLVFFAALIKNIERLMALKRSDLLRYEEWELSDHTFSNGVDNERVEEPDVLGDGCSNEEEVKLAESIVVKHAYYFFQIFKIFLKDLIFTSKQREISHKYFCKVSAMDALRIISVELQFMYEVLHTKKLAICSKSSYIFHFIAFIDIVVACILFNCLKNNKLPQLDVKITNALLFGGIALDVISLVMLVSSDWTIAKIKGYKTGSSKLVLFLHKLVSATDKLRQPRFAKVEAEPNAGFTYLVLDTLLIFRRWSETICACNLLSESLKESPRMMYKCNRLLGIIILSNIFSFPFRLAKKIIYCFPQDGETTPKSYCPRIPKHMITNIMYVSRSPFIKELWIFIFKEVKRKSEHANMREIFEARGDMFLKNSPGGIDCRYLLKYVTGANYDTSIIIWHLATEMWYNREELLMGSIERNEREFSKILSDYMLYLLLNQSDVVSAVVGTARSTSVEMMLELRDAIKDPPKDVKGLCKTLFEDSSKVKGVHLAKGIHLAKEMGSLGDRKWQVMSGVWVEILSYAAIHIKGVAHVRVLSKGGELLAFVWLLMAHFGCFYKPGWGMYRKFYGERSAIEERDDRDDSDDRDTSIVNDEFST